MEVSQLTTSNVLNIAFKELTNRPYEKSSQQKNPSTSTFALILLMWVVGSTVFAQAQGMHYADGLVTNVFTDPLQHCDFFFQGHDKIPPIFSFNRTTRNFMSPFAPKVLHKNGNVVKSASMGDHNCLLLSSNGPIRAHHFSCKKAFSIRNGRLTSKPAGPQLHYRALFQDGGSLQILLPLHNVQLAAAGGPPPLPALPGLGAGPGGGAGNVAGHGTVIPGVGRDLNRRALEERRCLTFYLHRYPEMQTGLALDLLELLPGLFSPDVEHKKKLHDLHASANHVKTDLGKLAEKLLQYP